MKDAELLTVINGAMEGLRAKSYRDLSIKMGYAPNYIFNLVEEGRRPSPEALAELLKAAGLDPTRPVMEFIRDQHSGEVKKILDKALKLMTAAAFAMLVYSVDSPTPVRAAELSISGKDIHYATIRCPQARSITLNPAAENVW